MVQFAPEWWFSLLRNNHTYLTFEEIADIKAIKAQYINESDCAELKTFLKKNGYEIKTLNRFNRENTFRIILDSFSDSVINHPAHRKYKEDNPNIGWSNEKTFVVSTYLSELNPKLDKIYDLAYSLNFDDAVRYINQKIEQVNGFDSVSFLLNADYDLKPFSIETVDKTLIENTVAIDKAISK
ncbi:MAG TPA: hypothetical protein VFC65_11650 [Prolixibacteraceae bacterium]|nr:hypothetical protein [Prolixibacteraceae bacterium]